MLLIVAYDWTDWLALGLIESACRNASCFRVLFQAPIGDYLMPPADAEKEPSTPWKPRQKYKRKYEKSRRLEVARSELVAPETLAGPGFGLEPGAAVSFRRWPRPLFPYLPPDSKRRQKSRPADDWRSTAAPLAILEML